MRTLLLGIEPDDFTNAQIDAIRTVVPEMHTLITTDRTQMERHLDDIEIAFQIIGNVTHRARRVNQTGNLAI